MRVCVIACLLALPISGWAQPTPALQGVPEAVQNRYNRLRSLKVEFQESVSYAGRTRREERGTLFLLRPRKMRWEYSQPAGKLFVSDGKMFYLYSPNSNQVQRLKPREVEDLRAPLAFLLGKLNFRKEFGKITLEDTPEGIRLTAEARTAQEGYNQAAFTVAPQSFEIRRIVVNGQDGLVTEFLFSGETVNLPLEARLFQFKPPAGAEIMEEAAR